MVTERLPGVHVGKVYLDKGNGDRRQGVPQGHAGVGVACRIDDDGGDSLLPGSVDALNEGALVIALEGFQVDACGFSQAGQVQIDVGKRHPSVVVGFADPQQIEVRAVDDQELGRGGLFGS